LYDRSGDKQEHGMTSAPRPIAFVMASTDHGTMIVNRFDYKMVTANAGFGVGHTLLGESAYDVDDVATGRTLLDARRLHFGDGVVAIDIGANIGVFTVEWARHMHGWGDILAFEPQERVFFALSGNVAINNCFNAHPRWAIVTNAPGAMRVPVADHTVPSSFGSLELRHRETNEPIGQTIDYDPARMMSLPAVSVDSMELPRLDLVKIDVEGMEMEVLEGARLTLGSQRPVLIIEHVKIDRSALHEFLDGFGYAWFAKGMNTVAIHRSDPTTAFRSDPN
jgi:FkbM family methyltransferase